MAGRPVDAVALDLFGTLAHWAPGSIASPASVLLALAHSDAVDIVRLTELVEGVDGERQFEQSSALLRENVYWTWQHASWRQAARYLGLELIDDIVSVLQLAVDKRQLLLYPDVTPALERLRAGGVPWLLCSNAAPDALAKLGELLPEHLRPVETLASCWLGCRKPHRDMFEAVSSACGLPAERVLFVGDRVDCDVIGSRDAGFLPVWLDRRQSGPANPPGAIATWHDLTPLRSDKGKGVA
jgi:putative hydrolase of the HAD superfamily